MDKEIKISQIKTVPNLMTLLRIVLIVPFVYFFINNQLLLAAITIGLSGLTDALDGFFARKLNQITPLGKILDPIADKLTLFAIMVCVTIYTPIIAPVMVILIAKDVLMIIGGSVLIKKKIAPPASKWYGKVGTFVFYISVCLIVFLKAAFGYQNDVLSLCLLSVTALIMLFSLVQYGIIFLSLLKENKNK